jgi:hypothetical protein
VAALLAPRVIPRQRGSVASDPHVRLLQCMSLFGIVQMMELCDCLG